MRIVCVTEIQADIELILIRFCFQQYINFNPHTIYCANELQHCHHDGHHLQYRPFGLFLLYFRERFEIFLWLWRRFPLEPYP